MSIVVPIFMSNGLALKNQGCSIDAEIDTGMGMLKMVNANNSAGLPVSVKALKVLHRDKRLN